MGYECLVMLNIKYDHYIWNTVYVYIVTAERERRNNSDGMVEMWIIADLGPAIALIDLQPNRCLARPLASHNLFMSIVS